jgi:DNA replication protein DnaC
MNDRIKSWLHWKKFPELHPETYSRFQEPWEVCPLCDGFEELDSGDGTVDCLCASTRWAKEVKQTLDPLRSPVNDADFNLEPVATQGAQLENAIVTSKLWAENPEGVLILSGGYGVGKSHLMSAINVELRPIALYLTFSEFEWSCFQALDSQKLHIYVDAVARAPILLFDDYGMEYGADLIETQITHVIDVRVRQIGYYPFAIATNKTGKQIKWEGRAGSRLMDTQNLTYVKMSGLTDYRTKGV